MIDNGDLVWRRTQRSQFANHYGIAVWLPGGLHVIHRQRENYGVVEPMEKFLLGFNLRGSKPTPISGMSNTDLVKRFDDWDAGEFNIRFNNCEQYAYRFAKLPNHSPDTDRRSKFLIALFVTLVVYYIINKPINQ